MLRLSGSELQGLKESQLTSEGTRIGALSPLMRFGQVPSYSPHHLVSQCVRKDLYKAVEGPSTKSIVLSMINGSYFRRRRRLTILEPDETKFSSNLTLLSL